MSNYWYDKPCFEPTAADEIFHEASERLKCALKNEIKEKMNSLLEENSSLRAKNEEMKLKVSSIERRESVLKSEEKNMERNVLRRKFSEMLKPLEEKMSIWRIEYKYIQGEKCNDCDIDREIEYRTPSGRKQSEDCKCAEQYRYYYPNQAEITTLSLYKKRDYPNTVSVTPKYDSASYDDVYCKFELKQYIEDLEDFENDVNNLFAEMRSMSEWKYNEIAFAKQEDCQKFANYLNRKSSIPKDIIERQVKGDE